MTKRKKIIIISSVSATVVAIALVAILCFMFMQPLMMGLQPITFVGATTTKSKVDGKDGFVRYSTKAGDVIPYETEYIQMPIATFKKSPKGTVVTEAYTTDVYNDGKTYEKRCVVYLPYGYNQNDTTKKYNVVYFQHGNNGYPEYLTRDVNLKQFDYMFATGEVEPVIIVMVTYYMDDTKTIAGDGTQLPANYYLEIRNDVIPMIEMKYNTYLKTTDGSLDAIEATREHRAFTGYSRGSACTWYMFRYNLKYFKYFAPSSYSTVGYHASALPSYLTDSDFVPTEYEDRDEDAFNFLKDAIDENIGKDFFIFVCSGHKKDGGEIRSQMNYFVRQTNVFQYGKNKNNGDNIYFALSEFPHSDDYIPFNYYNSLPVFFNQER